MQVQPQKVKTKVRFTSLDVSAMVSFIRENVVGQRITNIYDINPTTYLFKLSAGQNKNYLLVENGVRFHVTATKAQKNKMPTGFTMKFRKYLRAKRLEKIRQVGMERVVVLTFGSENFTNHLILELYSQGNIILTDNQYKIIQCIRSHQFTQTVKTAVGQFYPFEYAANIYLQTLDPSRDNILSIFKKQEEKQLKNDEKKKKKNSQMKLKQLLMKVIPCLFPQAAEHIILNQGLNPNEKSNAEQLDNIEKAAVAAIKFLNEFQTLNHSGHLYYTQSNEVVKYFDYSPFAPKSYENKLNKIFNNFSQAVDKYYADFKRPQNEDDLQGLAWKKYDQIKTDQDARLQRLINDQEESQLKAQLIEKNIDNVDAIIKIIRTLLDSGLSWNQIEESVYESKKQGDPLAQLIHNFNLSKEIVTILLEDPTIDAQLTELLPVDINVSYNAYTNAKYYYEDRKKNKQKELRTKEASQQVLKIAEKEALKDIQRKKNQRQQNVINTRKPYWFEKFYWMLTSQGYLVISGRDSHQNQLLVKKYMKAGDLYMHSDYGGAASTIIKNPTKLPLDRPALEEAAIFTVCRSKAWDTKIISGAWWVNSDQVSKSAPTGQFLPTGSFMIRGKKNFIYPNKMEMGVTLLYRLDQASAVRHSETKKPAEEVKVGQYQLQIQRAHEEKLKQQQFSIVSLEVAKKKGQQQQQNKNKDTSKQGTQNKVQTQKQKQKQPINEKDSEQNSDDDQESDGPTLKKTVSKQDKQKQKQKTQQKTVQPPPGHAKNKKKLQKLKKYLEEQDEEQREIIMKMLGAKEMKHRREEQSEEEVSVAAKGKKDKYNQKEKKNKDKFNLEDKEQKKLDKEKIPFLMKEDEPVIKKDNKNRGQDKQEKYKNPKQQKPQKANKNKQQQEVRKTQKPEEQQTTKIQQNQATTQQTAKQTVLQEQKQEEIKEKEQNQQAQKQKQKQKEQQDNDSDDQQEIQQQKAQEDNYDQDQKVLDSDMNDLNRLSGVIKAEDTYDTLIAMCAPYSTISDNRFKIKLTPGGVKKGKAARNILNFYTTMDLSDKQKMMLRGIPEQEVINCLVSGVKLAGAGLLKIQQKEKAEKKQKRKEKDREKEKEREKEKKKK